MSQGQLKVIFRVTSLNTVPLLKWMFIWLAGTFLKNKKKKRQSQILRINIRENIKAAYPYKVNFKLWRTWKHSQLSPSLVPYLSDFSFGIFPLCPHAYPCLPLIVLQQAIFLLVSKSLPSGRFPLQGSSLWGDGKSIDLTVLSDLL